MIKDKETRRALIAKRVAQELKTGNVVNLGIGLPTQVANYIPRDVSVILQSENGIVGMGPSPEEGQRDPDLVNAGSQFITALPGAACFDSAMSFAIIRGGHVDVTVLGALEVDEKGNLANWMVPGKIIPGMGGAMDLVIGAKKVIIAMEHTAKGKPKILKRCTLPLTAKGVVDMIVTDMGVFEMTRNGVVLKEIAPDTTLDEVKEATEADLIINEKLIVMEY